MNDFDKYEDLLPEYLSGRLSENQVRELEQQLENNPELRSALDELRRLSIGLAVFDAAAAGHIDSARMVAYSDDPDGFGEVERREIESHLEECAECREELSLCRAVPDTETEPRSVLAGFLQWFLTPRVHLRPAAVVAILCLLVAPQVYYVAVRDGAAPARAEFRLESASRDVRLANNLAINPEAALIEMEFVIPARKGCQYDIALYDATGEIVFTRPGYPAQNLLAVEIPTSYLEDGRYQLKVFELGTDAEPSEISTFALKVRFTSD